MEDTSKKWVTLKSLAEILDCNEETLRRKCAEGKILCKYKRSGKYKNYLINPESLPKKDYEKYKINTQKEDLLKLERNLETYSNAPKWARKQADKYLELFSLTKGLKRKALESFVNKWNIDFPQKATSIQSIYRARAKFNEFGVEGLLSNRGKYGNNTEINNDYYEYYKSLYLKEGAPSADFCRQVTLGYAKSKDNIDPMNFPSARTFDRLLKSRISKQAIYYARYGQSAWNKKYASFLPRDYSNINAGECWVSDHAQIDVAVNFNGNVCFPWVTVFRDVKTSKWLGWFLHADAPNSDHIFQAFYYGVEKFGLPNDVYLDNGKDYRCRDFAGKRKPVWSFKERGAHPLEETEHNNSDVRVSERNFTGAKGRTKLIKINHSSEKENALLLNIGVNVHFALPYNAQTKPVERDFLKIKSFLSKGFVGYRGGKITERPEKLKAEIKSDKIMNFDDFKTLFDDFIENYLNKKPSKGKVLQGKCPDELWSEEFKNKKVISKDALKLFCMRTSKPVKIGRNGVYDSQLQITYWGEWMICEKGRKVFVRRDINAYQEAWVFDAETEKYLGKGNVYHAVSFLARTNIEKAKYKEAIERKNKEKKIIKSYIKCKYSPTNEEIASNLKNALDKTEFESKPVVSEITNTKMDQVINIEKQKNIKPKYKYVAEPKPKPTLYLTESQKRRAETKLKRKAL